jgi:hypothetical protein
MDIIRDSIGPLTARITTHHCETASRFHWPDFLSAEPFTFTRFQAEDTDSLSLVLSDSENQRLLRQVYRVSSEQAATAVLDELQTKDVTLYTIQRSRCSQGRALIRLRHDAADKTLYQALFALPYCRELLICAVARTVGYIAFEVLHCERIELRTRTLGAGNEDVAQQCSGFGLTAVLRRQILVREESQESDVFRVEKAQWPLLQKALEAFMETSLR